MIHFLDQSSEQFFPCVISGFDAMPSARFEFYQLRCFVAVAEELNFRRAAERLNITQPPLSRQIRLLEEGIGMMLFERSNRSVRLTPAGESFMVSAVELLQRAEHAVLTARQAERGEAGAIALGFVPSAGLDFVPRIVDALALSLPDVTFNPTEMMSYEIIEALRSGQLDLGLTRMNDPSSGIESVRVVSERFVLVAPKDHPLATAPDPDIADLDGLNFIGHSSDRGGFLRAVHQRLFAAAGIVPRIVQEVSQTYTIIALVNRGIGIALVPASTRIMQLENVVFRDIELPGHYRSDLYLSHGPRRNSLLHMRVRAAILDALSEFRVTG